MCFVYNSDGWRPNSSLHLSTCSQHTLSLAHPYVPLTGKKTRFDSTVSQLVSFNMQQLKVPVWDHDTLNIRFVLGEETETIFRDMHCATEQFCLY